MRVHFLHLFVRDFFNLDAERAGHSGLTVNLFFALFGQRNSNRTDPFEARRNAGFFFKRTIKFLAILRELGHIRGRAQLRDQASGMPCGARGELFALKQHDVLPAKFGQMVSNGAANDATTDDDNAGFGRKFSH